MDYDDVIVFEWQLSDKDTLIVREMQDFKNDKSMIDFRLQRQGFCTKKGFKIPKQMFKNIILPALISKYM